MERTGYYEFLEQLATRPQIATEDTYFNKLHKIKSYYQHNEGKIVAHNTKYPFSVWDKDPIDWMGGVLTPIEEAAWMTMESKGRMPLYPQYPVGRFIVDFANPVKKIGIELDGREWHNEEKDTSRDGV